MSRLTLNNPARKSLYSTMVGILLHKYVHINPDDVNSNRDSNLHFTIAYISRVLFLPGENFGSLGTLCVCINFLYHWWQFLCIKSSPIPRLPKAFEVGSCIMYGICSSVHENNHQFAWAIQE